MPITTPILELTGYATTGDDTLTKFINYRTTSEGIGEASNIIKIDTAFGVLQSRVDSLENTPALLPVTATHISDNYYEANDVSGFTSLITDMVIMLKIDVINTGAMTLQINSTGTKQVYKYNSSGGLIALEASNAPYLGLYQYNGTAWILAGVNYQNQIDTLNTTTVKTTGNQTIAGVKTFSDNVVANAVQANKGIISSGYSATDLPAETDVVTMYYNTGVTTPIARIASFIKSALGVITYKALALGAYVGGKYSAMFNANGTVDFNFDVTVPTQTAGDSTTKVATTAFTQTAVNNKAPHVGTTAPTNTDLLWRDTSVSPAVLKQYNGSVWVGVGGGGFVTGIMTANGTVTLGFQPSSVFVFAHTFSYNSSDGNRTLARNFAFATYGHSQNVTVVGETLVITSTGFTTTSMFGNAAAEPSASYPLKYIAFK